MYTSGHGKRFALVSAVLMIMLYGSGTRSAVETNMEISSEMGTNIAAGLFPLSVKLDKAKLFLTEPEVLFIDTRRIGIQTRFQAYDHRPAEGIAISEKGLALLSGRLDYDPATREVLLYEPQMDKFVFDRDSEASQRLIEELNAAWSAQVTNPIRSEIPPHPYIGPLQDYIKDISYDGKNITLKIVYE